MRRIKFFNEKKLEHQLMLDIIDDTEHNLCYLLDDGFDFILNQYYDANKKYADKTFYFNTIRLTIGCLEGYQRHITDSRNPHIGYSLLNSNIANHIGQGNYLVDVEWYTVKDNILSYIERMSKKYNIVAIEFEDSLYSRVTGFNLSKKKIYTNDLIDLVNCPDFTFSSLTIVFIIDNI